MRARGTGTIERTARGFVPRLPGRGSRLGTFETEERASEALDGAIAQLAASPATRATSVASFGTRVLEAREIAGQRAARDYQSVFRVHVAGSWIGAVELRSLSRSDVVAWTKELATRRRLPGHKHGPAVKERRAKERISKSTAQNALNVLRIVLTDALEEDLIEENPADGVRLPTSLRKRARLDEGWSYLDEAETTSLVTCLDVPERERLAIAFAIGTGARQAEQWAIRWRDIDEARGLVTLRKTKSGKPRTVAMLPIALAAVRRWRELARSTAAERLVWTAPRGGARSGEPDRWDAYTAAAGLVAARRRDGRHVRWHDLRHTCATMLIQGWWSDPWPKEAIQEQLGHESVTTTERYAHLAGTLARRAAGSHLPNELPTDRAERERQLLVIIAAPPARVERTTNGLGTRSRSQRSR